MNAKDVLDAVEAGNRTTSEIADACDRHANHAGRVLKELADDDRIFRGKDGHSYVYYTPDEVAAGNVSPAELEGGSDAVQAARKQVGAESAADVDVPTTEQTTQDDGGMPLAKPRDEQVAELPEPSDEVYVPHGAELQKFDALVETRKFSGVAPHTLVSGPTGCGKTTFAETIAAKHDAKFVEIQMSAGTKKHDLVGSPAIIGGDSKWVDGPLVQALVASRDGPVVVLVDEANRAKAKAKGVLFDALDHRARVKLGGGRGGEVIQGDPDNIIVIATINEGDPYHGTYDIDAAEKRRYGSKHIVDYLGYDRNNSGVNVEKEAALVAEQAPVTEAVAAELVKAANEVRRKSRDETNTKIDMGVPTDAVIRWAGAAYAYDTAGMDDAVMQAAESEVVTPYFDGTTDAQSEVSNTLSSMVGGMPVTGDEAEHWAEDERVVCDSCDYEEPLSVADDQGATTFMDCPECNGDLREVEAD